MISITKDTEINMLDPAIDPGAVSTMAIKNRCPAIVILPEFVPAMLTDRSAKNGQYKIIAAIDFPAGKNYALDKLKHLDVMSLGVDGMDILLSHGKTDVETMNEMRSLVNFIKGSINPVMEIRWVLKSHSAKPEDIQVCLKAIEQFPPSMVRIDQHLELPNVTAESTADVAAKIKKLTPKPLKISGNVNLDMIKSIKALDKRCRFDVSPKQMIKLLNDIKQQEIQPTNPEEPNEV